MNYHKFRHYILEIGPTNIDKLIIMVFQMSSTIKKV